MMVFILLAVAIFISFMICALVVKVASMIFGFTFSWLIVFFVFLVLAILKDLFSRGGK